jgi:hypothetical protein
MYILHRAKANRNDRAVVPFLLSHSRGQRQPKDPKTPRALHDASGYLGIDSQPQPCLTLACLHNGRANPAKYSAQKLRSVSEARAAGPKLLGRNHRTWPRGSAWRIDGGVCPDPWCCVQSYSCLHPQVTAHPSEMQWTPFGRDLGSISCAVCFWREMLTDRADNRRLTQ